MPSASATRLLQAFVAGSLFGLTGAIRVAPGSPCSNGCGNVLDNTTPADIVCADTSFSSAAGVVFQGCLDCELTSTYVTNTQYGGNQSTDLQWLLYNSRYAVSYCVFGLPAGFATTNPCITSRACGPLQAAIEFGNLTASSHTFDYCAAWNTAQVPACESCLRAGNHFILANLVTLLDAGCVQQPLAGTTIAVAGEPFSSAIIIETTASPSLQSQYNTIPSFPLAASVGIAVAGFVAILFLIGCCIIWNGKRRRRAYLRQIEKRHSESFQNPTVNVDMYETPISQKPLRNWDDSPKSANTASRFWSPYASPVSAEDGRVHQAYPPWPIQTSFSPSSAASPNALSASTTLAPDSAQPIGMAIAGDHMFDTPTRKGKDRLNKDEAYEMQDVGDGIGSAIDPPSSLGNGRGRTPTPIQVAIPAEYPPVIRHPGFGRQAAIPRALTQDDVTRGYAI